MIVGKRPTLYYRLLGLALKGLAYPVALSGEKLFPKLKRRCLEMRGQGFPLYQREDPDEVHLWIHGASLGEVGVVEKLFWQLEKECQDYPLTFTLSAGTNAGVEALKAKFGSLADIHYAPLDLPGWPDQALSSRKPDAMIFVETEIWPHWIQACSKNNIPVFMVNGRISARSFPKYQKISGLLKNILSHIEAFTMISDTDARRIQMLGAPMEKITVCGNIKRDILLPDCFSHVPDKKSLGLDEKAQIWVCGSIRKGEEIPILKTFAKLRKEFPDLYLILAPRHLRRLNSMERAADRAGFAHTRLSDKTKKPTPVFFLDSMGKLLWYYALADVVFCGGSLVPAGGQNLLEAASCAKPVLFGPSMEDFEEEKNLLLEAGAAFEVVDAEDLYEGISLLLRFPEEADTMGKKGFTAIEKAAGSTSCHAKIILSHLQKTRE